MKRKAVAVYAAFCTLTLVAGFLVGFFFAWRGGLEDTIDCVVGLLCGVALAPCIHELGHIALAKAHKMRCVYSKFFCFQLVEKKGKLRLRFASPFSADKTQAVPLCGGNMQKRAAAYTLGGLLFSGVFLVVVLAAAITLAALGLTNYTLWGLLPCSAYLFLLNVAPAEYASGKTDMLVYIGLKRGEPAERNMLAAMEIQGRLYEGKSFSQIDEALYFDLPQLPEDEPLFAVMLDLRYRYALEKGDLDKAGDYLNRLTQAQAYLTEREVEKIAAELTYMHAIGGDLERAEACGKLCREYLQSGEATAKRILAAYSLAAGKMEAVEPLKKQAEEALANESCAGEAQFERILLSRIKNA